MIFDLEIVEGELDDVIGQHLEQPAAVGEVVVIVRVIGRLEHAAGRFETPATTYKCRSTPNIHD